MVAVAKILFYIQCFLSKKLFIFIFNGKKYFYYVKILSFKENIFIFNQNIFVFKNFYFHPDFFYLKNIFIQSKINAFNEIFLFNDFR